MQREDVERLAEELEGRARNSDCFCPNHRAAKSLRALLDRAEALREALTRGLNALRAAASRGPVSSREIFSLTDPMMDRLSRATLARWKCATCGGDVPSKCDGMACSAPQPAPADREALGLAILKANSASGVYMSLEKSEILADALLDKFDIREKAK